MNTIMHSEIFFFISSIGFVITVSLLAVILFYCIKAVSSFTRILERIESSMDSIGDATMELIEDLRDNVFFRLLFRPKKKGRSTQQK